MLFRSPAAPGRAIRSAQDCRSACAAAGLALGQDAAALFAATLHVRPGIAGLVTDPRIALKFGVALAMAASAGAPGARWIAASLASHRAVLA